MYDVSSTLTELFTLNLLILLIEIYTNNALSIQLLLVKVHL